MSYAIHHPYSSLTVAVLEKYRNPLFIETGTNVGHGVQVALDAGFPRVYSMEADPALYQISRARFDQRPDVDILHTTSPAGLRRVLQGAPVPATIYLDAHEAPTTPLIPELTVIRQCGWPALTILIDDVRMFGTPAWGGVTLSEALQLLHQINPRYQYRLEPTTNGPADLLVAYMEAR